MTSLFGLPITLSVVPEEEKVPQLLPELEKSAGAAPRLLRASASPFSDTASRGALAANRRQTLIIAGFATEVVVLSLRSTRCEQGTKSSWPSTPAGDVGTDGSRGDRTAQGGGALVTSVVSIATALSPDFTTEKGKQMFQIVQQLRPA